MPRFNHTAARLALTLTAAALLAGTASAKPTAATESAATDAVTDTPTVSTGTDSSGAAASSLGDIADILDYGFDGTWHGETDGNGYRLVNPETPDAIRYYFLNTDPAVDGSRSVGITVVPLQGDGMAGLIYGYEDDPKQYHLVVADATGAIRAFHRAADGSFNQTFTALPGDNESTGGPVLTKLALVEQGDSVEIHLNDTRIGAFESAGTGAVGIAAVGIIDAVFIDFELAAGE